MIDTVFKISYPENLGPQWLNADNIKLLFHDSLRHDIQVIDVSERSEHQQSVESLMNRIPGQEIPSKFRPLTEKDRILRAKLIMEEALEKCVALGVQVQPPWDSNHSSRSVTLVELGFKIEGEPDYVKIIDGCLDLRVIATGTLSLMGIPDVQMQRFVDEANLSKFEGPKCPDHPNQEMKLTQYPNEPQEWFCPHEACMRTRPLEGGPYLRDDGKWIKPPYFVAPDIKIKEFYDKLKSH